MATPADQRLLELCDKWLKSLELHIRYSGLDTESYWKVQPWPEHQRPSRWIIDLAVQKAVALRSQVQERIKQGDTRFSDSLELMTFLANLIGSEHIERFIPLADPEHEVDLRAPAPEDAASDPPHAAPSRPSPDPPRVAPARPAPIPPAAHAEPQPAAPSRPQASARAPEPTARGPQPSDSVGATATREMPQFVATKRRAPAVGTSHVARTERRSAQTKAAPRPSGRQPAKLQASEDASREQVIVDAARLVQWGRKWYELAELIARMADRPPLPEVRKILKDNKTAIEKKAGGS
ncbi:MAG TPA: hypothetical protein VGL87_06740 [Steroidobacteraceae bacterium]